MTLGVRAIVDDGEGRFLLVRHTYVEGWHLPGGGVEVGQSLQQALATELREEANVILTGRVQLLGVCQNKKVTKRDHVAIYHCPDWEMSAPKKPDNEIAQTGFFAFDELPEGTTQSTRKRLVEWRSSIPPAEIW